MERRDGGRGGRKTPGWEVGKKGRNSSVGKTGLEKLTREGGAGEEERIMPCWEGVTAGGKGRKSLGGNEGRVRELRKKLEWE